MSTKRYLSVKLISPNSEESLELIAELLEGMSIEEQRIAQLYFKLGVQRVLESQGVKTEVRRWDDPPPLEKDTPL